ncbi:MAG: ACP S-malonyltransferase [Dehalococcoidia bacterium]
MNQASAPRALASKLLQLPADPTLALVFPGQGSQKVGMARDLCSSSTPAKEVFDAADAALGFSLSTLCFEGPEDSLTVTSNTQPAILTASIAILAAALDAETIDRRPAFVAGHSLGEYSALVAAGSLDFTVAVQLVRERGRLMEQAGQALPGTLAAIVGLDQAAVEAICKDSGAEVANYNAPTQTVIGGPADAVERACALAKERGGRGLPVKVSGAFHTSLMESAAVAFTQHLTGVQIDDARIPVIANVTSNAITTATDVRADLEQQVRSPVLWHQSIDAMANAGVTRVIEVGPGKILTAQLKRSHPKLGVRALEELSETANV